MCSDNLGFARMFRTVHECGCAQQEVASSHKNQTREDRGWPPGVTVLIEAMLSVHRRSARAETPQHVCDRISVRMTSVTGRRHRGHDHDMALPVETLALETVTPQAETSAGVVVV
jgi:hypothetical protein